MYLKLGSICPPFSGEGFGHYQSGGTLATCGHLNKEEATCKIENNNPCEGFNVVTLPLIQLKNFLIAISVLAKEANFNHLSTEARETLDEIERKLKEE